MPLWLSWFVIPLIGGAAVHLRKSFRLSLVHAAAIALDVAIAASAIGLALTIFTSGVDLGVVSVHGAAKPLLILLVLVPVRIAVGGRSWLADLMQRATAAAGVPLQMAQARAPAAVVDTLFAVRLNESTTADVAQ